MKLLTPAFQRTAKFGTRSAKPIVSCWRAMDAEKGGRWSMVAVAVASYAKDLEIVVFNGHVHTTELYVVDGVKYLLLGGGGAEQDPILPGRTAIKVPAG